MSPAEQKVFNHSENVAIVNSILVSYELIESLDIIEKTRYFKQEVKSKVKALLPVLERTNAIHEIWGIGDDALYENLRKKQLLMKRLAVLRPELKTGLEIVLDRYFQNPELTLELLGVQINK